MRDTPTHKHTKPAVPRLVIMLVAWLCVSMALPSTTAELYSIARIGFLNVKAFAPGEVGVTSKDQLVFRGLDHLTLRVQFTSSCRDDRVDGGVEVKDGETVNVKDLFSRTSSATAFAAFEGVGCKKGSMVKINLQDPTPPKKPPGGKSTPPKTSGKNTTESSDDAQAKNATENSHHEHEDDRNVTQTKSGGNDETLASSLNNSANAEVSDEEDDDDDNYRFSPVTAAVVGSIASFGFAALCAVGFMFYRRHQLRRSGATIQGGEKSLEEPSLVVQQNKTPGSSGNENGARHPAVILNEAPPVYEAAVCTPIFEHDEKTGLVQAEGNETNHEVVMNPPNCEIVGHMSIDHTYTHSGTRQPTTPK